MDHPAVHFYGENVVLPAQVLGENRHRILVDLVGIQIDVVDSEGFLDELGDLLEGENIAIDESLGDVGCLLSSPALDQLGRDPRHGPD